MKIAVCCKIVPDPQDVVVDGYGMPSVARAKWMVNEYDLPALEVGKRLAAEIGADFVAITVGDARIDKSLIVKDLLSRGPQALYMVVDDALEGADTAAVARLLKAAIQKVEADLVLFGAGSADVFYQQMGLQVGQRLEWVTLDSVSAIEAKGEGLRVFRNVERETETYDVQLPAALSVTASITTPKAPSMRDILAASKRPVERWALDDLGGEVGNATVVVRDFVPENPDRKGQVIEGSAEEAVEKLISALKQDSLL